jgi:F-type H+-transporting ATPase subunit c
MDFQTALGLTLPVGFAAAAIGSAIALGKAVSTAMESIARQPEAAGKIQTSMIIGAAFIEALTIYALLTVLILQGKLGG